MPYIKDDDREQLEIFLNDLIVTLVDGDLKTTAGTMNYLFTRLSQAYLDDKGLNYQHINDMIGALESAKMELYRRVAVPYEEKKIIENGDVLLKNLRETDPTVTEVYTINNNVILNEVKK